MAAICWICNEEEAPSDSYTGLCYACETEQDGEKTLPKEFRAEKPKEKYRNVSPQGKLNRTDLLMSLEQDAVEAKVLQPRTKPQRSRREDQLRRGETVDQWMSRLRAGRTPNR